nr:putative DNA binding domain-containing protein [Anaerolineae bacterium]
MDLHLHTPASSDYQQAEVTYLDILHQAERRGLDIIAFTDHNTVRGYREMLDDIHHLEWLASSGRINSEEERRLAEYHRLFEKMLVLPGFEFTATFGFHILGIFPPQTDIRTLEHLLLSLNIPTTDLDSGETNVGASSDVLSAYEAIHEAGGMAIAAHANSSHGVAMRGMSFGGQTRIAYTQDPNLFALEVTDLDRRGRRTTTRFFDGSKPEYPRPMRCIQGSDAHRLERDPRNPKNLGIGERLTEILLPELSYSAVYDVFAGNDLALTRPYRSSTAPFDHVLVARQEGSTIVQEFHEGMSKRGGRLYAIIADICAFSNTNGGTLYIGATVNPKVKPTGVNNIHEAVEQIRSEVEHRITPPIDVDVDILHTESVPVIRVQVPRGSDPPYAIDDNKIYVRDDTDTGLAVRDEIVQLVVSGLSQVPQAQPLEEANEIPESDDQNEAEVDPPRTGVEIVGSEKRNKAIYHHVRDLRNGNVVRNVTRASARKLWHYAITQAEGNPPDFKALEWHGDIAVIARYEQAGRERYDLAQRIDGAIRVYYGVTEDGIQHSKHTQWRGILGLEDDD